MKEFKHFELRSTRKPGTDQRLASMVTVVDEEGEPGYAYILFSDSFVKTVGRAMPRGVSLDDPAHLHVVYDNRRSMWVVHGRYVAGDSVRELWLSETKPDWLNIIKTPRGKSGNNPPSTNRA